MPLIGINPSAPQQKGPSRLEQVAIGFDIASKALGTALAIPEFIAKKNQQQLDKSKTIADIGSTTEAAQSGEPGAFEVPGIGFRKPMPSLQSQLQSMGLAEKARSGATPSEEEYQELLRLRPGSDIQTLKKIYPTRGDLQDILGRTAGATTIKMEDPFQREKFTYEKGQKVEEEKVKKAQRYVPSLNQYALTDTDAKETKEAIATQESIKKNIDTLVGLRTKYGGGQVLDREDAARAKQISTGLLLKYKKLMQLGVLSKTDIDLIDQLVPKDPLEIVPSELFGQDPIMARLKGLHGQINDDLEIFFKTKGFYIPEEYFNKPVTSVGGLTPERESRRQELLKKKGQ